MLFALIYFDKDVWQISNSHGERWCGDEQWVHLNSSWYALDPDCFPTNFTYSELKNFVKEHFDTDI